MHLIDFAKWRSVCARQPHLPGADGKEHSCTAIRQWVVVLQECRKTGLTVKYCCEACALLYRMLFRIRMFLWGVYAGSMGALVLESWRLRKWTTGSAPA